MSTNAMPGSDGRCERNAVNASKPPADAPTPATGNDCVGPIGGRALPVAAAPAAVAAPPAVAAPGTTGRCGTVGAGLDLFAEGFARPGIFFAMRDSLLVTANRQRPGAGLCVDGWGTRNRHRSRSTFIIEQAMARTLGGHAELNC